MCEHHTQGCWERWLLKNKEDFGIAKFSCVINKKERKVKILISPSQSQLEMHLNACPCMKVCCLFLCFSNTFLSSVQSSHQLLARIANKLMFINEGCMVLDFCRYPILSIYYFQLFAKTVLWHSHSKMCNKFDFFKEMWFGSNAKTTWMMNIGIIGRMLISFKFFISWYWSLADITVHPCPKC